MIGDILRKISQGDLENITPNEAQQLIGWGDALTNGADLLGQIFKGTSNVATLSQITSDLGSVNRGTFISGDDGDPNDTSGNNPFTGVVMQYPGKAIGSDEASIYGMNAGDVQFWLSALTGKIIAGGGSVSLNSDGVTLEDAGDAITLKDADNGGYALISYRDNGGVQDDALTLLNYQVSTETNQISNGDFETGDFTSWTETDPGGVLSVVTDPDKDSNSVWKIDSGADFTSYLNQTVVTSNGYVVKLKAKSTGYSVLRVQNDTETYDVKVPGVNEWITLYFFISNQGTNDLDIGCVSATADIYIDDITVRPLNGLLGYSQLDLRGQGLKMVRGDAVLNDTTVAGTLTVGDEMLLTGEQNESMTASATVDVDINVTVVRIDADGDYDIYGFSGGSSKVHENSKITVFNVDSTNVLTLKEESASASQTYWRIITGVGDVTLNPGESRSFWYDPTSDRWRMIAGAHTPVALQFVATGGGNPADASTYYVGQGRNLTAPSAGEVRVYIPVTGTVTRIDLIIQFNSYGTNETSSIYFRLNDTTDTLISSSVDNSAIFTASSTPSIAVSAGDFFEIKWITPTWATNPTGNMVSGTVFIT